MINLTHDTLSQFIERLPVAIACFDENRRYIAINQRCAELNGVSQNNTLGKTIYEVVPELADTIAPIFDRVYLNTESINDKLVEGKTPASDKTRYWLASYQPLPLSNGKKGLLVTAEEVTQQIFATKSAETNRKLLTDVLNSLFTFVGLLDAKGVLLDANRAPLQAAGIKLEDVKGQYFWDCYWWTYSEQSRNKIMQAVKEVQKGAVVRFDIDLKAVTGLLAIDFMMKGLYDRHGELTHIIPSAIDISERKKTEQQLKVSQSRFETVINRTVDGLVACDRNGCIHLVNNSFEAFTTHTIEVGVANIFDFLDSDDLRQRLSSLIELVDKEGIAVAIEQATKNVQQDVCLLKPSQNPVEVAFSPLLDGDQVLYLATISDVSALYKANQALEKALLEKTVLLNEVHHRVKNNLQVMSSLLSLQANADGTHDTTKHALLDTQRRLKSMALIHQLLYEREDFTYANLQQFTEQLLDLLQESMVNGSSVTVIKEFTHNPITLSLNQIVPYGFLMTELITNAYKHAFVKTNVEKPMIVVNLKETECCIEVRVADNGNGYTPNPQDIKHKRSLGSDLIMVFSRQLKATLTSATQDGVVHTFTFNK